MDKTLSKKTVKRTERGWAGHYCCADKCLFRRNTLLSRNDIFIVVSTVGLLRRDGDEKYGHVNPGSYYETMAFFSKKQDTTYHDADVSRQINIESFSSLSYLDDNKANEMHENIVDELIIKMEKGEIEYAITS